MNDSEIKQLLSNPYWRLNNLYYIVDKGGRKVKFRMNWAQKRLWDDSWYCNIILKARQLGISTYICVLFLDKALFNTNISCGILAHTLEDAQHLFKRVKFAYDCLPNSIRELITADNDSSNMLKFSNGSSIRVGTSLRSSTFQYLHISEFGKICAKYPDKAREIITGSLNTLAAGQYCFIESTAEGKEGYFYDICKRAKDQHDSGIELSKLDFKFHFFPWFGDQSYRIGSVASMSEDLLEYFVSLKSLGIYLDDEQKSWYALRLATQADDMKREYPSFPDECWEQSHEGRYYARQITTARIEKRICHVPYDEGLEVHSAWDLGYNDSNAIWLFQVYGKEIRCIEYIEGSGESLAYWINLLKNKDYGYGKHLAPHDITTHEYSSGVNRQTTARKLGLSMLAVPKIQIIVGIDNVRAILNRCWFDANKCGKGLIALENYKKEWDDRHGCWKSQPLHNASSHGADAFRTLANGLHFITGRKTQGELEREQMEYVRDESGLYPGSYLYTPKNPMQSSHDRFSPNFHGIRR